MHWFSTPQISKSISRQNFILTQIDAIGVGIARSAGTFLPIFLSRYNASSLEISLLISMPAIAGFLFAIPLGRIMQKNGNIIRWYAWSRAFYIGGYFFSGFIPFFLPQKLWVTAILVIWAIISIPQIILDITFNVVMNRIGGADGRYELMSRRWAILGLVTSIFTFIAGQFLKLLEAPRNFQITLMVLSAGGIFSLLSSLRLQIPNDSIKIQIDPTEPNKNLHRVVREVLNNKPFIAIVIKRLVFSAGASFGAALFALYFVRGIDTTNTWIAAFSTVQTAVMVIGYFFWSRFSRKKGTRPILIWTTLIISLYPIAIALNSNNWLILVISLIAGLFQAGLDLVLFDELMRTFPQDQSSIYISVSQSLQYFIAITFPLLGSLVANQFGLAIALIISGLIKLIGFLMVILDNSKAQEPILP